MTREDHLILLRDESKSVIERLKAAVQLEVDYWDNPNKSPPNLSQDEFKKILNFIPLNSAIRWVKRKSTSGHYGKTGEGLSVVNYENGTPAVALINCNTNITNAFNEMLSEMKKYDSDYLQKLFFLVDYLQCKTDLFLSDLLEFHTLF